MTKTNKKRAAQCRQIVPAEIIEQRIYLIRGQKVMLDRDLAELYEVPTHRLNEQVKRNRGRFPDDFMFQLTRPEKNKLIANCDKLGSLKFSPANPYVFTEKGVAMLSSVLNSERAIQVNIAIMRIFSKLREMMATHQDLKMKIEEMEKKYDKQFQIVFTALKRLLEEPEKSKNPIGFHAAKRG